MRESDLKKRLGAFKSPWNIKNYRVRAVTPIEAEELPREYNGLLGYLPKPPLTDVFPNQGNVGSCVGWDFMIVMETQYNLIDMCFDELSASWIYQKSRDYSVPPIIDIQGEGSTNFGACRALNNVGASTRSLCPEDTESPFKFNPMIGSNDEAKKYAVDSYWDVNSTPADVKASIYGVTHEMPYKMPDGSLGKTAIGSAFPVFKSFYDATTNGGVVPIPKSGEQFLGGHSSALVGWKEVDGVIHYINMGSWGDDLADKGFFYIPENYPFYSNDFKLLHIGPPTDNPIPTPSNCPVAKIWKEIYNIPNSLVGGKTRLEAVVPRR